MAVKSVFSFIRLRGHVLHAFCRFPFVLCLLLVLTVYLLLFVHMGKTVISERWDMFFMLYLSSASVLTLSLNLWAEEHRHSRRSLMGQAGVSLLWLGACLLFCRNYPMSVDSIIGFAACATAIVASLFFGSFLRQPNDVSKWNFMSRIFSNAVLSFAVSVLVWGALALLIEAFYKLLGIKFYFGMTGDVFIVCSTLLAPMMFLAFVPEGKEKLTSEPRFLSPFFLGTVHYLFFPLVAVYLLTLYAYAFKIIFLWTLPCGWVSWMVSCSMLGTVAIIFMIYPIQYVGGGKTDRFILRWLPLSVAPLLVLMTVAVGRRISDYGITIARLYLLIFNIWCYIVCIGLFRIRSRRFGWVISSFVLVFLMCSIGPQSVANLTYHKLKSEVKADIMKSGNRHLPLDVAGLEAWKVFLKKSGSDKALGRLVYLQEFYGDEKVADLVDSSALQRLTAIVYEDSSVGYNLSSSDNYFEIPEGYRYVKSVYDASIDLEPLSGKDGRWKFSLDADKDSHQPIETFFVSKKLVEKLSKEENTPVLKLRNANAELHLSHFSCNFYDGVSQWRAEVEGILFYN